MISVFAEPAAQGAQQVAETPGAMDMLISLLPMVLLFVVFYFMLIRPQRKKEKETKAMLAALKVGDDIITIGGIVGTIVKIKDDKVIIETGTKTEKYAMTLLRSSISTVNKKLSAD